MNTSWSPVVGMARCSSGTLQKPQGHCKSTRSTLRRQEGKLSGLMGFLWMKRIWGYKHGEMSSGNKKFKLQCLSCVLDVPLGLRNWERRRGQASQQSVGACFGTTSSREFRCFLYTVRTCLPYPALRERQVDFSQRHHKIAFRSSVGFLRIFRMCGSKSIKH